MLFKLYYVFFARYLEFYFSDLEKFPVISSKSTTANNFVVRSKPKSPDSFHDLPRISKESLKAKEVYLNLISSWYCQE